MSVVDDLKTRALDFAPVSARDGGEIARQERRYECTCCNVSGYSAMHFFWSVSHACTGSAGSRGQWVITIVTRRLRRGADALALFP